MANNYRRINIDGDSLFKTETRKCAAALLPGTFAVINGADKFAQAAGVVGRMYVVDVAYHEGLGIRDAVPVDHSAVGNYVEEGREMAVLMAVGSYTKDQPITVIAGRAAAVPAAAGTYQIIGYSQDTVTLTDANFVRVRMRASSVVVA